MVDTLENDWIGYLAQGFSGLPRSADDFFVKLWHEGRLQFSGRSGCPDRFDEMSARLVCATLHQRERLLIILPDRVPRRPALLFATGLIMHGLDQMKVSQFGGQVLYFGSTIGIRDQLGNVRVGDLTLDAVFPQVHLIRQDPSKTRPITPSHHGQPSSLHLPKVICVYAPVDPIAVLKQHYADWIAIDCGDEPTLRWLPALLGYACSHGLPVVAWCQSALSESIADFARAGIKVFHWPHAPVSFVSSPPAYETASTQGHESNMTTQVTPLFLDGSKLADVTTPLQNAYHILARASQQHNGQLSRDALHLGWSYLRSVESLPVPFDLYEAEARHRWGLKSIARLREGLERFMEATRPIYPSLSADLEQAAAHLNGALEQIRRSEPPLWGALTRLCVSDVPDGTACLIVFPSTARKQLFAFALLARYNISEDDLRELRIWLMSPKDLHREVVHRETGDGDSGAWEDDILISEINLDWEVLLVGLPSPTLSARLEPALRQRKVEILVYPYQAPALACRIEKWQALLNVNLTENMNILSQLGGKRPSSPPPELPVRLKMGIPQTVTAEPRSTGQPSARDATPLWQPNDPIEEVSWLLVEDEDEPLVESILESSSEEIISDRKDSDEKLAWVERAIEVRFDGGWHGLFALDDTINIVYSGADGEQVEERYIQSLRPRDKVLFIHGQRRQSLYDLIISRVHQHPAIELHLALVQRWHDDLATSYREWQRRQMRGLDELLWEMKKRGSQRESVLTLQQWLRGETLCPQDAEDLRRVAEILDMGFVRQYYQRIYRAASRLRGLHRGLANRLNRWLREQAAGIDAGNIGEIFDEELGLSLQDFRDSILILQVKSVAAKPGPFLRANLGLLERGEGSE